MLVEKSYLDLRNEFITEDGFTIKKPVAAYEEYGAKNGPVVVISPGGVTSPHAAGVYKDETTPGWFDALIGPDKCIDTNQYRVICVENLGGVFGTTGPNTINPDTGKKYGQTFPWITIRDQARFLKATLEGLGVKKVDWIMGQSQGSMVALQTAVLYPEYIGAVTPMETAAYMTPGGVAYHNAIINTVITHPNYADGEYISNESMASALQSAMIWGFLFVTHYTFFEKLTSDIGLGDQLSKIEVIHNYLEPWAKAKALELDANGLIRNANSVNGYNLANGFDRLEEALSRLSMPVLALNIDTDFMFPPKYAEELADMINTYNPGMAEYKIIKSIYGHLCGGIEPEKFTEHLNAFKKKIF